MNFRIQALIYLILCIICSCVQAQNTYSRQDELAMVKDFYVGYITEFSKRPTLENRKNVSEIKVKYCTKKLLHNIENMKLDYDPFLKAQDSNVECLKTLTVKKDLNKLNLFTVSYIDDYSKEKITINLSVIKQKDIYKIDSVW